jgi:hypothetical protein
MSKFSALFYLNAYSDSHSSNAPDRNNFKWTRNYNGVSVRNPIGYGFSLAPGETKTLFNGVRALTQDNTTQYSIAPVAGNPNLYALSWVGGTNPTFRTGRTSGANATTQVTVTLNGPVLTFTSTGGQNFNLISGGVVVGDYVRIGNLFNVANQGMADWKIISVTATSFSVSNQIGAAEGPITLGSGFANQIDIYSAAGVQIGDTLQILSGFSPVTQGSYQVTGVSDKFLQFASLSILPTEGPFATEPIAVYSQAQKMVYLESDQNVTMSINGVSGSNLGPFATTDACGNPLCSGNQPGVFMTTSTIWSLTVTNTSTNTANLFFAAVA